MNILYLLNEFPKISESFIINEIYELEKRGHDITIISFRKNKSTVQHDEFEQLNATVWYLPAPGIDSAFNTIGKWINIGEAQRQFRTLSAKQAIGSAYIAGNIHSVIQTLECNPDHVHTHFFDWPKFALGYLQFDVPTSITAHAFGLFAEGTNNQRRALAKYVDRIVTISEYNQKYLCDTVGVQTPVDTVRMGIRPNKFEPTTQNTPGRLLTVARFVDKKGIKYAIDAVAHLVEEYPEIEYHLIGTGPRENAIRNRIHDQEIEEHVSMLNTVSDKRLIKELDEASMFLLPCVVASDGDRDGIPVALMEAMAMEVIPISTSISGIPELIDNGTNGLLSSPRDAQAISALVRKILENPQDGVKIADNARQTIVEQYNAANLGKNMERIFKECRDGYK